MSAFEQIRRDFIVGLRLHARTPVATACVVVTLAIGVAATSASFALLNALFIRPLPVREPDGLVRVYRHDGNSPQHFPISYPDFEEIRRLRHVFTGAAAEEPAPLILGSAGSYERAWGEIVSPGYFSELGVVPLQGRFFTAAEEESGDAVAVIGEALWERRFGRDPNVVNVDVRVEGRPFRVIGVAPGAFHGTVLGFVSDLWIPVRSAPGHEQAAGHGYFTLARLASNVDVALAQEALDTLARRLQAERPESNRAVRFALFRESEGRIPPPFRDSFLGFSLLGLTVALLVTAVACANVAGILLARAAGRRAEMAVRLALGASRRRVAAQLLTESAALSLAAGVLGVAVAWQATRLLSAIRLPIARGASISFDLGVDFRTLAVSLAVTVATVLLVGLAPALESSRLDLVSALKGAGNATRRGSPSRRALLSVQVAVSMTLLAGGSLFLRSFQHAREVDLGFDPAGVVATAVDTGARAYTPDRGRAFWSRLLSEVRRLPRVESASLTTRLPLELGIVMTSLAPEGFVAADANVWPSIEFAIVQPGYFDTMYIPLIKGRDFTDRDTGGVAIVNDVLARQFWPDMEAIGRHLVTRDGGRLTVIGIARRSKYLAVGEAPKPYVYFAVGQDAPRAMTIVARGAGDSGALLRAIGDAVRRLDPQAPIYDVTTMSGRVAVSLAPASGGAAALGIVAVVALALTAVGLFGSVAHTVSRRTYEIGVRRALGAPDGSVVWLMTRDAVVPVGIGIAAGVAAAFAAWPALRAILYDVQPFDPLAIGLAPAMLLTVCAAAAWLPAHRATRISAAAALRRE